MTRQSFTLISPHVRQNACRAIMDAPQGARVEIKEQKRSLAQNARLWAHLSDIAAQRKHYGLTLSPEDWKVLFMDALKQENRIAPNLYGNGMVSLGRSSSDLSVKEMADLITIIEAFGAEHGVVFADQVAA